MSDKERLTKMIINTTAAKNTTPSDIADELIRRGVVLLPEVREGDIVYLKDGTIAKVEAVGKFENGGWMRIRFCKGDYVVEQFRGINEIGKEIFILEREAR